MLDHPGRHPPHQGRLDDAVATYQRALGLAASGAGTVLPGTADMYVGLSGVAVQRWHLDAATAHLLRSQEVGEPAAVLRAEELGLLSRTAHQLTAIVEGGGRRLTNHHAAHHM